MNLAPHILGSTAVTKLQETERSAVITIGSDTLTRRQLAAVGCYNFIAAQRLGDILTHVVQAPNLRYVFEQVPPAALVIPKVGVISLAVLGACLEAKGIGGSSPLDAYYKRHLPEGAKIHTFSTDKHREAQEAAREAKERRRRKAARKNQAHALRVERFEQRAG